MRKSTIMFIISTIMCFLLWELYICKQKKITIRCKAILSCKKRKV